MNTPQSFPVVFTHRELAAVTEQVESAIQANLVDGHTLTGPALLAAAKAQPLEQRRRFGTDRRVAICEKLHGALTRKGAGAPRRAVRAR